MSIWLPPEVQRKQEKVREMHLAEVNAFAQLTGVCKEWTRILKEIDPDLEMVWFGDDAKAAGVTPGRFHAVRWNGALPPTLIPVTGPEGEFIFPNSSLLDKLRELDSRSSQSVKARRKREKAIEDAKVRQQEREREERIEEFADRWKALEPGVSMTGQGSGWKYRAGARAAK